MRCTLLRNFAHNGLPTKNKKAGDMRAGKSGLPGTASALGWQQEFMEHLWHVDGLAQLSLREVGHELERWRCWLTIRGQSWDEVTSVDIREWLSEIVDHQARSTVDKRSWVLRRLYRWGCQRNFVAVDPWLDVTRPTHPHRWQPRFTPSRAAVDRLLSQPDTGTSLGVRDRAILELLYATGLRAAELLSLYCHQINPRERAIRVLGKGGVERMVVYGESARTWLRYYLLGARGRLLQRSGRQVDKLFVHDRGRGPLSYAVLSRMIKCYAVAAELPLLTAHSLRHAFATHLYQGGADLRTIQMLLGHACLTTTTVYARPSVSQLIEMLEHHHPRGKDYEVTRARQSWRDAKVQRVEPANDGFEPLLTVRRWPAANVSTFLLTRQSGGGIARAP